MTERQRESDAVPQDEEEQSAAVRRREQASERNVVAVEMETEKRAQRWRE